MVNVFPNDVRCRHGHSRLAHPRCFVTGKPKPWWVEKDGKHVDMGFLDIETTGLDATFGCVTSGHRILKSDLTWVPVESLKAGDILLGFDEEPSGGGDTKKHRVFKESKVIMNIPLMKECYAVHLEDDKVLTATGDHPWLVKRDERYVWRTTTELIHVQGKNEMPLLFNTWEASDTYEAGYLSAFIDGEGNLHQAPVKDRDLEYSWLKVQATQDTKLNQCVLDKALEYITDLGFSYSVWNHDSKDTCKRICISGGRAESLRFLGTVRPAKLKNLDVNKLGHIRSKKDIKILKIVPVGWQVVYGLQTSTKTYIVEGFGSHNTMLSWAVADYNTSKVASMVTDRAHIQSEDEDKWLVEGLIEEALKYPVICTYYGARFDIPFWRTRAEEHKIQFPAYGSIVHFDMFYQVRSKLRMGRNRLENVARMLQLPDEKTHLDARIWRRAGQGDSKSLKYVLHHNIVDVKLLKEAYKRLEYTFRGTRTSI